MNTKDVARKRVGWEVPCEKGKRVLSSSPLAARDPRPVTRSPAARDLDEGLEEGVPAAAFDSRLRRGILSAGLLIDTPN